MALCDISRESLIGMVYRDGQLVTHESSPSEHMSEDDLIALKEAGRAAGGYLMDIGVTDMTRMSKEQWTKFCSIMVLTFEQQLIGRANGLCS